MWVGGLEVQAEADSEHWPEGQEPGRGSGGSCPLLERQGGRKLAGHTLGPGAGSKRFL